MEQRSKANVLLIGRCTYNAKTGIAEYNNYSKYYKYNFNYSII